jgi:hypothetical protein
MPPSSRQSTEYWAPPMSIFDTSFESNRCKSSAASRPDVSISPMWETSKTPQDVRTAMCSCRTPS